jgi:hypothetical protein
MTDIVHPISSARTYVWVILLGLVGFYFGYNGQFLLLKKTAISNTAPLLGIFLTGPLGLFLGLLLGTLSTRLQLNAKQNLISLAIAVVLGSVGTLYLAVGEFNETVRLVDAEILGCKKIDNLLESQTKMWSEAPAVIRAMKERRPDARLNWEQEIPNMVRDQPGVILTIYIYHEAWVREQKWRWGGVSKKVDNWKSSSETQQVFAPIAEPAPPLPCERFVIGERKFSALVYERSYGTPPATLPAFLWLYVFKPVPPEYVRYIPK